MKVKATRVYREIAANIRKFRIIVSYGGSSSSKTISAMQAMTAACMKQKRIVTTVIGESVPVLKRSVILDWRNIVMGDYFESERYNYSERIYHFHSGSIMQFVPGDHPARFHGPRQDYALFDEAYNIKKDIFDQVEIRTRKNILLTWNPVSPFWGMHLGDREDCLVIHSTYKDNRFIEKSIAESLERRAGMDQNFYRVYVLGEYGSLEGLIFREHKNWFITDDWPVDESKKEYWKWRVFGLDFGYTHDPTTYCEVRYCDGDLYVKQHFWEVELTNDLIAKKIKALGMEREDNVADSAEPKSIKEIRNFGIKIRGAEKGPDSVKYGINTIKQYRVFCLRESVDLIKEFRNYSWAKNTLGEYTGKPVDMFNHGMDNLRYAVTAKLKYPGTGNYAVS